MNRNFNSAFFSPTPLADTPNDFACDLEELGKRAQRVGWGFEIIEGRFSEMWGQTHCVTMGRLGHPYLPLITNSPTAYYLHQALETMVGILEGRTDQDIRERCKQKYGGCFENVASFRDFPDKG